MKMACNGKWLEAKSLWKNLLNPLKKKEGNFHVCASLPYLNVFFFVFRLSLFHFTVHTRRREERGKCELKMKKLYFVY